MPLAVVGEVSCWNFPAKRRRACLASSLRWSASFKRSASRTKWKMEGGVGGLRGTAGVTGVAVRGGSELWGPVRGGGVVGGEDFFDGDVEGLGLRIGECGLRNEGEELFLHRGPVVALVEGVGEGEEVVGLEAVEVLGGVVEAVGVVDAEAGA